MKKPLLFALSAVGAVSVLLVLMFKPAGDTGVPAEPPPAAGTQDPAASPVIPAVLPPKQVPVVVPETPIQTSPEVVLKPKRPVRDPVPMSDEQYKQIIESFEVAAPMSSFLDNGDELNAIYEARKLIGHANREVRHEVVRSLEWIGLPAAMELASMVDDDDEEIREIARDAFWKALEEAENPVLKRDLLAQALRSGDAEVRENALNELVFIPDRLSFPVLASAINDPNPEIAALARENTSFVSGEDFSSAAQAMIWYEANKDQLEEE